MERVRDVPVRKFGRDVRGVLPLLLGPLASDHVLGELVGLLVGRRLVLGHYDQVIVGDRAVLLGRLGQYHLDLLAVHHPVEIGLDHRLRGGHLRGDGNFGGRPVLAVPRHRAHVHVVRGERLQLVYRGRGHRRVEQDLPAGHDLRLRDPLRVDELFHRVERHFVVHRVQPYRRFPREGHRVGGRVGRPQVQGDVLRLHLHRHLLAQPSQPCLVPGCHRDRVLGELLQVDQIRGLGEPDRLLLPLVQILDRGRRVEYLVAEDLAAVGDRLPPDLHARVRRGHRLDGHRRPPHILLRHYGDLLGDGPAPPRRPRDHVEHVLGVLLQIRENRPRPRRVPVNRGRVVVLLVELHVVTDYLTVPVLPERHVPRNAHRVRRLEEVG